MAADPRLAASLQGGVRADILNSVVGPDTAALASAQAAAETGENRRRRVASQTPGLGVLVQLPPPVAGPGVGITDVPLPMAGEGMEVPPAVSDAQAGSYGPRAPVYADPVVGGFTYPDAISEPVFRASVSPGVVLAPVPASPARPSLLGRLAGWLRGRG